MSEEKEPNGFLETAKKVAITVVAALTAASILGIANLHMRTTTIEVSATAHERQQDVDQGRIEKRLERIEEKIDRLVERRV